jgi:hypothetical protein
VSGQTPFLGEKFHRKQEGATTYVLLPSYQDACGLLCFKTFLSADDISWKVIWEFWGEGTAICSIHSLLFLFPATLENLRDWPTTLGKVRTKAGAWELVTYIICILMFATQHMNE